MKRIIITESQYERLKLNLNEATAHSNKIEKMKTFLDANYEPIEKYVRKGGEYSSSVMVKNKIDDEELSLKELKQYLKFKFEFEDDTNDKFVEQVITDWMYGRIGDDNMLTKNIPLN
jgi:hypothetical protein